MDNNTIQEIFQKISNIEKRLSRIENHLNLEPQQPQEEIEFNLFSKKPSAGGRESLEFHIGQFWFAKVGIVVFAIGIAFLLTFPYKNLPHFLPSLFGFLLVAGIGTLSQVWRNSLPHIARYLLGGGLILFYFSTLRLFFFSTQPTIVNLSLEVFFLSVVVALSLVVSVRRQSVFLIGLSLTLGYITAILTESALLTFGLIVVVSALTIYFKLKYQWHSLAIYAIIITYLSHFIWFINNPFLGNTIQLVSSPGINIYFVLLYITIFAIGNLFREKDTPEDNTITAGSFLNLFGGYGLFFILTITKFQSHISLSHLIASLLFLSFAIFFWLRERSKYSTFFYSIFGYSALSVAIIAGFKSPDFFVWLSWQSVLVIITALWFRSKIIVLANFIIYLLLFIASLMVAGKIGGISVSFGIVALLSARIMNWQKHRLELKTEFMRNAYLVAAFIIIPYALYHTVPSGYVSLSWIGVAIFYYILSLILQNIKYRWMALFTLLLTVIYLLVIGIIQLDPVYRIVSFIILGIVLLVISIIYSKSRTREKVDE